VVHVYNPRYSGGGGRRIINSRLVLPKVARPVSKPKYKQKDWKHDSGGRVLA
jgi:hypothetical protein